MLFFDTKTHTYRNEHTRQEYISATKFLNKFKAVFDAHGIAERIALREGKTKEEILQSWEKTNTESKNYGTKLHSVLEKFLEDKIIEEGYLDFITAFKELNIILKEDELLVEQQVYSHVHKLAGTADIIRLEDKGGFSIFDLKTNKKFNLTSPYNDKMLKPIDHLHACEYTLYSLQLSLYAYMYHSMTGRTLNQLGIFYYERNSNKFLYYPVMYMKSDIVELLNFYAKS